MPLRVFVTLVNRYKKLTGCDPEESDRGIAFITTDHLEIDIGFQQNRRASITTEPPSSVMPSHSLNPELGPSTFDYVTPDEFKMLIVFKERGSGSSVDAQPANTSNTSRLWVIREEKAIERTLAYDFITRDGCINEVS